jgi:hypothetical protein
MSSANSTNDADLNIKKLDNEGRNYRTWVTRCRMVLDSLDLWDVVDPNATTSTRPTPADPTKPDAMVIEWDRKDQKALSRIGLAVEDTPLAIVEEKDSAKDAWKALAEQYIGAGAHDASLLMSRLHEFQLDGSKPLEPQINQMRKMRTQMATLGDKITDAKFAMIISKALPSSYDTLKTITVATVSDVSKLAVDTLIAQILREEKRKGSQKSATALVAKSEKLSDKTPNEKNNKKSKKGKNRPRCTNPKCNKIGHTLEQCWAKGGASEGQRPVKSDSGQSPVSKNSGRKKEAKVEVLVAQEEALLVNSDIATQQSEWVIDSGASSHICPNKQWFSSYTPLDPPRPIYLGDRRTLYAVGQGHIEIAIHNGLDDINAVIEDVLHCPKIGTNLLSVTHLTRLGSKVKFIRNECQIFNPINDLIGIARSYNGLYRLSCTIWEPEQAYVTKYIGERERNVQAINLVRSTTTMAPLNVWHARLGHISVESILKMVRSGMAKGMDITGERKDKSVYCEECEMSAHTQSPIPKETLNRSKEALGRVFSNVCDVQTVTRQGYRYFITFVDDFSQYLTIYPIKRKSEALEQFKEFLSQSEQQLGKRLKVLCTDGGGEYFSTEFVEYLKAEGIVHEKTNPDTLQENGVAEHVNRTLVTMTIAMLESVKTVIGRTAWPFALQHAALIKNVVPHPALPDGISPYELWTGSKPSVTTIRTFGCKATLSIPGKQGDKLDPPSITGIHLGLANNKKAFIIYDPETRKILESQDVHFFEGSTESERVTIEVPEVESGSHVVQRDEEVEGQRAERAEGGATSIMECGNKEPGEMNGRVKDGLNDDMQEEIVPEMPRRSGRVRRGRVRDDNHRYFVSSYNRGNQPDKPYDAQQEGKGTRLCSPYRSSMHLSWGPRSTRQQTPGLKLARMNSFL